MNIMLRLRHIAVLAFAGWHLMIPPLSTFDQCDSPQSLSTWTVGRGFETARDCRDGLTKCVEKANDGQDLGSVRACKCAACIAIDDLRLKLSNETQRSDPATSMGWYLIGPPTKQSLTPVALIDTPLPQWWILSSWDRLRDCEDALKVRYHHEQAYLLAKGDVTPPQNLLADVIDFTYTTRRLFGGMLRRIATLPLPAG